MRREQRNYISCKVRTNSTITQWESEVRSQRPTGQTRSWYLLYAFLWFLEGLNHLVYQTGTLYCLIIAALHVLNVELVCVIHVKRAHYTKMRTENDVSNH